MKTPMKAVAEVLAQLNIAETAHAAGDEGSAWSAVAKARRILQQIIEGDEMNVEEPKTYVCRKCHAGCRADMGIATLRMFGFEPGRETHDAGSCKCGGEVALVFSGEAGAGWGPPVQSGEN